MATCVKCHRSMSDSELRPLPLALRIALYPLAHRYSQADEELRGRYCPICRRVYSVLLVVVGAAVAIVLLYFSMMW